MGIKSLYAVFKKYNRLRKWLTVLFQTFFFPADRESFLSSNIHSILDSLPPTWQAQLNQTTAANKSVIKFRSEFVKCDNEEADLGDYLVALGKK